MGHPVFSEDKKGAYGSWRGMIDRCTSGNHKSCHLYIKRGITVCEEWLNFESFFRDMGTRPPGKSIDRIDNDKGYFPGNCRWATSKEQALNRRRTRWYTHNGETKCLEDWSRHYGFRKGVLDQRLKSNEPFEVAIRNFWRAPTKLFAKDYPEIMQMAAAGISRKLIAVRFKVKVNQIGRIIRGETQGQIAPDTTFQPLPCAAIQ